MLRQLCLQLRCHHGSLVSLSRGVKDSTYLKGLNVDPDAWKHTPAALNGLKDYVQEKIPQGAAYRDYVTEYCTRFLKAIEDAPSQADAEEVLGRQYEQIQQDVEAEKTVIDTMAQWRPWETPEGHVPKLFADMKNIPENVRAFREFQHNMGTK